MTPSTSNGSYNAQEPVAAKYHAAANGKRTDHLKTFKYTIRTQEGDLVSGVVEANSKDEGIAHLRGEHAVVVSIDEVPEGININIGHMHIKDKALALMCNQFAIIMGAGLPIVRTVQLVAGQTTDKTLRKVLLDVAST